MIQKLTLATLMAFGLSATAVAQQASSPANTPPSDTAAGMPGGPNKDKPSDTQGSATGNTGSSSSGSMSGSSPSTSGSAGSTGSTYGASGSSGSASGSPSGMSGGMAGMHDQSMVREVQQQLQSKGHNPGQIDGIMGEQTKQALRDFQKAQGMEASGELDSQTASALGVSATGSGSSSGMSGSGSTGSSGTSGSGTTGGTTGGSTSGTGR